MMNPERLWAKSKRDDEPLRDSMLLPGHLKDVHKAAGKVLDATGDEQLRAVGLNPGSYRGRLRRCVQQAAAVHDLGKANDHFQTMVRGKRDGLVRPQGLRHEWVTVLMLQELKTWLLPFIGDETDFRIVEWAVSGHHPAAHHCSPPRLCPPGAGADIKFYVADEDFLRTLEWLKQTFSLGEIPAMNLEPRSLVGLNNVFGKLGEWERESRRIWNERFLHEAEGRFVAVVKNCLIAADVAGSALPTKVSGADSINWGWIGESFSAKPQPEDLQSIVDERLDGKEPREFQKEVANSKSAVTFVKAGCGAGKTVAAYLWAA